MGHSIGTVALLGLMFGPDESRKLHAALMDRTQGMPGVTNDTYSMLEALSGLTAPYKVSMVADESDGRIQSNEYEPGLEHGFGIVLARKGYGGRDSSEQFQLKINQNSDAEEAMFEQALAPILRAAGLSDTPWTVVVSCAG